MRRYPCLIAHEGHPGLQARVIDSDTDLLAGTGVEYIPIGNGDVIEHLYSKPFRAALHYHMVESGSQEEADILTSSEGAQA